MSEGKRIPLELARSIAEGWVAQLRPFCARVEVAGSVRRRKETIGDIEIVCLPHDPIGLFYLLYSKPTTKGTYPHLGGRYMQLVLPEHEDMKLDLFFCSQHTWGQNLFIRTGSAEFSQAMATRSQQLGFIWQEARVFRRRGGRPDGDPILVPEERDVFNLFQVRWVEPEARTDKQALLAAVKR